MDKILQLDFDDLMLLSLSQPGDIINFDKEIPITISVEKFDYAEVSCFDCCLRKIESCKIAGKFCYCNVNPIRVFFKS